MIFKEKNMPIFRVHSLPISYCLLFLCIVVPISILKTTRAEIIDIFSWQTWLDAVQNLPLYAWLMLAFVGLLTLFMHNLKLVITPQEIYTESFGIVINPIAEHTHMQQVQLYSALYAEKTLLKSFQNKKYMSLAQQWKRSFVGISMKPEYRHLYKIGKIHIHHLNEIERQELLMFLQQHWGLKPERIFATEIFARLAIKHKLR
jgi:hypothetical protein